MSRATLDVEGLVVQETLEDNGDGTLTLVWEADGVRVTQRMEHYSNTMVDLARIRAKSELLGGS